MSVVLRPVLTSALLWLSYLTGSPVRKRCGTLKRITSRVASMPLAGKKRSPVSAALARNEAPSWSWSSFTAIVLYSRPSVSVPPPKVAIGVLPLLRYCTTSPLPSPWSGNVIVSVSRLTSVEGWNVSVKGSPVGSDLATAITRTSPSALTVEPAPMNARTVGALVASALAAPMSTPPPP